MRRDYFVYRGLCSRDYGVLLNGKETTAAPEREVETVSIPGRSGDLHMDKSRWKNVTLQYPCAIVRDFEANFTALKQALLIGTDYGRLEDTLHPDEYRLAAFRGPIEPSTTPYNRAGEFTLAFDCKPQRFLKAGEEAVTVSSGGVLYNPTGFPALPLLTLNLTGDARLQVGGVTVAIAGYTGVMVLDCELQDAYRDGANLNRYITAPEFPTLGAGANKISWTGGIASCAVTPRWWTL